jgi:hypothetical protein
MGFFIIFNSNWGKDEPQTLRYAIMLNCSMGADAGHAQFQAFARRQTPLGVENACSTGKIK